MILDFIDTEIDGDSWELLCDKCYRIRYQSVHFQKVPASYRGDCGIEGYTHSGVVYQCYCPEKEYSDDDLFDHQRDKMTADINKLCSDENGKRLLKIGVPPIKEWHFVIPYYKDKRILEHAQKKKLEVVGKKQDTSNLFDHIDEEFKIVIKIADDFKPEIAQTIRQSLSDYKISLLARRSESFSWKDCPSEKVANIRRKIEAVMIGASEDIVEKIVGA